jgi:hypothetical protein
MLLGPPLTQRQRPGGGPSDPSLAELHAHLDALVRLLPEVYADSDASKQAQLEFAKILRLGNSQDEACCKRAALLLGLALEKEVGDFLETQPEGGDFARDLRQRVLPFILPRFARNSFQAPDSFVVLACVLGEMWEGEALGNWPLDQGARAPRLVP